MISYRQETQSCSKGIMEEIGSPDSELLATERYLGSLQNGLDRSFTEETDFSSQPHIILDYCGCPYENGYHSSHNRSVKIGIPDQTKNLKRKSRDKSDVSGCRGSHSSICYMGNRYSGERFGHSRPTSGQVSVSYKNSGTVVSSKTRLKWTQDLHDRFEDCVSSLGGAEKATPKAILKLMGSDGLTIYQVKSHLQKYRMSKYWPVSEKGLDKSTSIHTISPIENSIGMQFKDALQMQLAVQRQLQEQLEIQKTLQLRIEEQTKELKNMYDQHRQEKANKSQNSDIITFLQGDDHSTNFVSERNLDFEDDSENALFPSKIC